MKKLSLIVALAVVLTIGGVFATWTYDDGTADKGTGTTGVGITAIVGETAKGKISVSAPTTLNIHNGGSYVTAWSTVESDLVTITFTPGDTASDEIKANGIGYTVKIEEDFGSVTIGEDSIDILTIPTATFDLTQGTDGSFTATFNLRSKVSVTAATLDTSEKHGDYSDALASHTGHKERRFRCPTAYTRQNPYVVCCTRSASALGCSPSRPCR